MRKDQSTPNDVEYKGLKDAAQKIYDNEGGLAGFYTGVVQDTGKTIADSFFFFLAYNFIRSTRIAARSSASSEASLPAIEELTVGFLAGSFTKLLTTPIANIVTRKQASAMTSAQSEDSGKEPSTSQIAHDIFDQKGILGFWSGYSASLILTLNPSLTFFLFETFKRLLPASQRSNPPAAATFFMAAFSKACASALTYPFSLAKSRAQVGGQADEEGENKAIDEKTKDASGGVLSGGRKQRAVIFSTILEIVQTEGYQGLYEGLHLEIAKGFFSHGITMIVKQAIHKLIIQAYYIIAIIVSRYRKRANPEALAQNAKQQSYEYYDLAKARAVERVAAAKEQMLEAQKGASGFVNGLTGGVTGVMNNAMDRANETAELVADYVEEETEEWRSLYGTGLAKWFDEK